MVLWVICYLYLPLLTITYHYLPLLTTPCQCLRVFPEFGGVCLLIKKHVKHGSCLREQEREKGILLPLAKFWWCPWHEPKMVIPPTTLRGGVKGPVIQVFSSAVWWSKELLLTFSMTGRRYRDLSIGHSGGPSANIDTAEIVLKQKQVDWFGWIEAMQDLMVNDSVLFVQK